VFSVSNTSRVATKNHWIVSQLYINRKKNTNNARRKGAYHSRRQPILLLSPRNDCWERGELQQPVHATNLAPDFPWNPTTHHWIPPQDRVYLVMDNAGGHGTREAREECTRWLLEEFNVEIIQQSARSPEVNALDLGIWMSVQSAVECRHQEWWRDPDGLAISVQEAWQHLPEDTIHRVFERIPIVLHLILDCCGYSFAGVKKNYDRSKFSQGENVRPVKDTIILPY
jgi:hypothetical protein